MAKKGIKCGGLMIYIVDKTSPQLSTLYAEVVSEYCGLLQLVTP